MNRTNNQSIEVLQRSTLLYIQLVESGEIRRARSLVKKIVKIQSGHRIPLNPIVKGGW